MDDELVLCSWCHCSIVDWPFILPEYPDNPLCSMACVDAVLESVRKADEDVVVGDVSLVRADELLQLDVRVPAQIDGLTHVFSYGGGGYEMFFLLAGPTLAVRYRIAIGGGRPLPEIIPGVGFSNLLDYVCVHASINAWRIEAGLHYLDPESTYPCDFLDGRPCNYYDHHDQRFRQYLDRGFERALRYIEGIYLKELDPSNHH